MEINKIGNNLRKAEIMIITDYTNTQYGMRMTKIEDNSTYSNFKITKIKESPIDIKYSTKLVEINNTLPTKTTTTTTSFQPFDSYNKVLVSDENDNTPTYEVSSLEDNEIGVIQSSNYKKGDNTPPWITTTTTTTVYKGYDAIKNSKSKKKHIFKASSKKKDNDKVTYSTKANGNNNIIPGNCSTTTTIVNYKPFITSTKGLESNVKGTKVIYKESPKENDVVDVTYSSNSFEVDNKFPSNTIVTTTIGKPIIIKTTVLKPIKNFRNPIYNTSPIEDNAVDVTYSSNSDYSNNKTRTTITGLKPYTNNKTETVPPMF